MANNHSAFIAKFGTEKQQKPLFDSTDGRAVLSKYGDQSTLDRLTNNLHDDYHVDKENHHKNDDYKVDAVSAANVIERGSPANRDKIYKTVFPHENVHAGMAMAIHGSPEQKTSMLNHDNDAVKRQVAYHGSDADRSTLIDHGDRSMRRAVAEAPSLSLQHATHLANDEEPSVSVHAISRIADRAEHLNNQQLNDLSNHEHPTVRNIANRAIGNKKENG